MWQRGSDMMAWGCLAHRSHEFCCCYALPRSKITNRLQLSRLKALRCRRKKVVGAPFHGQKRGIRGYGLLDAFRACKARATLPQLHFAFQSLQFFVLLLTNLFPEPPSLGSRTIWEPKFVNKSLQLLLLLTVEVKATSQAP